MPDHLTSVWIPRLAAPLGGELEALDDLVRRLRRDCPWDREQTHASLTRHLLEEAYEVVDAIAGDPGGAGRRRRQAERSPTSKRSWATCCSRSTSTPAWPPRRGRFTLADVARGVHDKLVARHPHVFGDVVAEDPGTVVANWEQIKKAEKGRQSVTDGIPAALPALALSAKLQRKAWSVPGLDLPGFEQERAWVEAALAQLPAPAAGAAAAGEGGTAAAETARQVGALLWSLADLGRQLGVEPEDALRATAGRFAAHVRAAEQREVGAGSTAG